MILVDTSVWIDHLHKEDPGLQRLLSAVQVLSHPFVIGELAMGSLRKRDIILDALHDLPQATVANDEEVLQHISTKSLWGQDIGYIDAHLLTSVKLTSGSLLWTRDKRLLEVASRLGLAFESAS